MTAMPIMAEANGFGSTTATRMRSVLLDRAAARRHFDTLISTPRAGAHYVAGKAESLGVNRALRYLGGKARWVLSLAITAGPGNVTVLALTTPTGRNTVLSVLRMAARVASWPLRLALAPFAFLTRHTGKPGRKVEAFATAGYCITRDKTAKATFDAHCWVADHDSHPLVDIARSVAFYRLVGNLLRRFGITGWWGVAARLAIIAVTPDMGEERTGRRFINALTKGSEALRTIEADAAKQAAKNVPFTKAAESHAEPLKAVPAPVSAPASGGADSAATATPLTGVVRRAGNSVEWQIPGTSYTPAAVPIELTVTRAGGVKEVVKAHRQADGVMVYQFGKRLYVGQMPADVDHNDVAVAIAAAEASVTGDAPAPGNRASRRAQERVQKRQ